MPQRLICAFFLLAGAARLFAGVDHWTSGGPDGGYTISFAIDPKDPSTLYAVDGDSLYKSSDAGATWHPLALSSVVLVAVSPSDPNVVYTDRDRSADGGQTWAPMAPVMEGDPSDPTIVAIRFLAVDAADPNTLYGGFEGIYANGPQRSVAGVAKSTDGGQSWTTGFSVTAPTFAPRMTAFAVSQSGTPRIYAALQSVAPARPRIYVSVDRGATWTYTSVTPTPVNLAAGPGGVAYAGTLQPGGVLKTADSGAAWVSANSGIPDVDEAVVALDPTNPATLYAATSTGLFKSSDAAVSWVPVNPSLTPVSIAVDPSSPATLYSWGGSPDGVRRSVDGGVTWAPRNSGMHDARVVSVAVDPAQPLTVFAGLQGGIARSLDGGSSWTRFSIVLPFDNVADVLVDPGNSRFVYGAVASGHPGAGGLIRSSDGGETWARATDGLPTGSFNANSLTESRTSTVFAGTSGGVYRSYDRGVSWRGSLGGLFVTVVRVNPADDRVWAATDAGLYSSGDGGATWSLEEFGGRTVRAFDINGPAGYAVLDDGLWKLMANGGWNRVEPGLRSVSSLLIDPSRTSVAYAATTAGVFQTINDGAGWSAMNNGAYLAERAGGEWVHDLAIDPAGSRLYAATDSASVFHLERSHRVVLPAAASLHGIAPTYFHSDVAIFNTSTSKTATVTATYRCLGGNCGDPVRTLTVPPRASLPVDDIVASLFGAPETGGAIELDSTESILVTSRLYTPERSAPTLGMFVPGRRPEQSFPRSVLSSLSHSADAAAGSRTNLGMFNVYDEPQTVRVSLFDLSGASIGQLERRLDPHGVVQINDADLFTELAVAGDVPGFYAIVEGEPDKSVFSYAVVLDNQSQDLIFVNGSDASALAPTTLTLPAAASVHGAGGSFFHSDAMVVNLSRRDNIVPGDMQMNSACILGSCTPAAHSFTLPPAHAAVFEDVLGNTLASPEAGAAIQFQSSYAPIAVSSRLYTPSHPDPTVGMFVPGLSSADAAGPAVISSLSYSPSAGSGSRVNVGVYTTASPTTVTFRLYRASGELLGETKRELSLVSGVQINDLFGTLGITEEVPSAYCLVSADNFGPMYAYAVVIDNRSQDPIFVPGLQDPGTAPVP